MNVKSKFAGRNSRNNFANPLTSINSELFLYLKNFIVWLTEWGKLPNSNGKLTRETYSALLHSVTVMIELAEYSFSTLNIEFILFGKLQTDNLEARFGEYRQLSGSNYLVSVKQILEAEKKLKIYSLLCLTSSVYGHFSIRNFAEAMSHEGDECDSVFEDGIQSDVDKVFFHIDPNDCELLCVEGTEESLVYIAGYVSSKISRKTQCISCKALLQMEKTLTVDVQPEIATDYIQLLDRGGLKYPSKLITLLTFVSYAAMQRLISPELEAKFLACKQHKKLLIHIVTCSIVKHCVDEFSGMCANGCPKASIISKALSPLSNVLLNNYRKMHNDKTVSSSNKRKLAKFSH
uniref:Uncharacterized protein n=3 Tax=Arion vulgaris TaxID=1028688 RepID=A0A0B7BS26_9EUPU